MNGSFINEFAVSSTAPEVGMGATRLFWTDRRAATIVGVSASGRSVTVREDFADRADSFGMSDSQVYDYRPNPAGAETTYSLRKNGRWVRVGETMYGGERLLIGTRMEYYDYSF